MRDRFGEEAEFSVRIYYRFSRPIIEIAHVGDVVRIESALRHILRVKAEVAAGISAPVLIIVSNLPPETSLPGADSACALTNMFNAAHALGLGTVWINQLNNCCGDPAVREILTAFGVPTDHVVYGCAAVGHPAADLPARAAKNPDVVSWVE